MDDKIIVHYSSPNDPPHPILDDVAINTLCDSQRERQAREERQAHKERQALLKRKDQEDQGDQWEKGGPEEKEERRRKKEQKRREERERNMIRLNDGVIVKHRNVTIEECRNQVEARRLLDPKIIVVPEVYRYFSKGSRYYLVMVFIEGTVRNLVEDDESIIRIARIIYHLQTHESKVPGPLCGGTSRGLFWENEYVELVSPDRLEMYINRRMFGKHKGHSFRVEKLVLNHNDIAPRNIIWMPDGRVCLIDWAHAGYYPWLLELAVLDFSTQARKDAVFACKLQNELGRSLTVRERSDVGILSMAWFNGLRYAIIHLEPLDR